MKIKFIIVALHPEGVDRNRGANVELKHYRVSPSTRRAWIEIGISSKAQKTALVALHPEGVDRNVLMKS